MRVLTRGFGVLGFWGFGVARKFEPSNPLYRQDVKGTPELKVSCPYCGNDDDFYEVAEGVTITTFYVQNEDGSFSTVSDDSKFREK